jgi:uncharacterized membrane protein YccF (DUF307 family)
MARDRTSAADRVTAAVRTLGNILWLVLVGWWLATAYALAGVLNCLTIIGIPLGLQAFKLAGYALWPFGRVVVRIPDAHGAVSLLGNVIWLVLGGFVLVLVQLVAGVALCITIVGIPFGIACFKLAGLALTPFGRRVVSASAVPAGAVVVVATPGT